MTPDQADMMIAAQQYTNDILQTQGASLASLQAVGAAIFIGILVVAAFVIVFGIISATQNRPRGA